MCPPANEKNTCRSPARAPYKRGQPVCGSDCARCPRIFRLTLHSCPMADRALFRLINQALDIIARLLILNPSLKDFEPIPRESCIDGLYAMQLCEEKLYLLCRACSHCPGCKRAICRRCHPGKCPNVAHGFSKFDWPRPGRSLEKSP